MTDLLRVGLILVTTVLFDGHHATCVVDTGYAVTLVQRSVAAQLALAPAEGPSDILALSGQVVPTTLHRVQEVEAGDMTWPDVIVEVAPDGSTWHPCILGTNVLSRQAIVLDWRHGRVRAAE